VCGIVGFTGNAGADPLAVLEQMLTPIINRGPDDQGFWHRAGVGLGHARLSVIDLSDLGHQPFVTADGQGVLAYNGEVYNYRKLRRSLQQQEGVVFTSDTDTEVVLYALHKWGPEQAICRLEGMFAFAYYDCRNQSLWLARDRFGMKPLFVSRGHGRLVFASEQKSLFLHPHVNLEPEQHALFTLLNYERFQGEMTPYRGIKALLPGCLYKFNQGHEACSTYFDVLRDVNPERILSQSTPDAHEDVRSLEDKLTKSIEMHLISDAPLATMCSGGLDSGLVTAIAKGFKPNLVSYVADIEGMHGQEVRRAEIIADALDLELRTVPVDVGTYLRTLPEAIVANDQPLYFSQEVASMAIARKLREDGFKVVLTGDGADEVFGGYDRHALAHRRWRHARLKARWIPDIWLTRTLGRQIPNLLPIDLSEESYRYLDFPVRYNSVVSEFRAAFIDGAPRSLRERRLFGKFEGLPLEDRGFLAASFEDIYVHMRERLNTFDKMTMHHSIEARVPFLDNDLVDYGLHLPVRSKYRGGVTKYVIKRLAAKLLPRRIVHLPKIGFATSPTLWQGTHEFLRGGQVAELLRWQTQDQTEILDLLQTQPYFQFRLLSMEIWLRTTFEGQHPSDISEELLALRNSA